MALQSRAMHFPAGLPIDQSTRFEHGQAGQTNRTSENVRQPDKGALEKRLGFGSLVKTRTSGSARAAGSRLFSHRGAPGTIDGTYLDIYNATQAKSVNAGRVCEATYSLMGLPVSADYHDLVDGELCNSYYVTSLLDAAGGSPSKASVIDVATGIVEMEPTTVRSGSGMDILLLTSFSNRYVVGVCQIVGTTNANAYILDTQNLGSGWSLLATVATGISVNCWVSACSLSDRVAIVYGTSTGTDRVVVKTYNQTGLLETKNIPTSSTSPVSVDVHGSVAGTLWVTWSIAQDVYAMGLDADSLSTTLATAANIFTMVSGTTYDLRVCESATSGEARIWAVVSGVHEFTTYTADVMTTSGAAAINGSMFYTYAIAPAGRPFQYGGRFYRAVGTDGDTNQGNLFVIDSTDNQFWARPIANIEPGLVPYRSIWAKTCLDGNGLAYHPFTILKSGSVTTYSSQSGAAGANLLVLDFTYAGWKCVEHAGLTYMTGAITNVFDGIRVYEAEFLHSPPKPWTSLSGGPGLTGDYRYVCVYKDVDEFGNVTTSGVSSATDVVSPANQTVGVLTLGIQLSARRAKGNLRCEFYRTTATGEAPYYFCGYGLVQNTAYVTLTDTMSDAILATQPLLYGNGVLPGTGGSSQDRRAPPGLHLLASYNGMLVGAKSSTLYFSSQEIYGEEVWWSPVFTVEIPGADDITALGQMDGTLFVFKRDRIYAIAGQSPSDNGLQGGFGEPRLLSSDVGCVESRSIVNTSLGVFFRSARGYELLTRGQSVEPIGNPILPTLDAYPVTSAAVLDDRNSLVRISLAASEDAGTVGGDGVDLIFDLVLKTWVSIDIKNARAFSELGDAGEPAQDARMLRTGGVWRYAWLGVDGTVYIERDSSDANAHLDGVNFVDALYELPPIKFGLQQEQRIYNAMVLFERASAAGLRIEVANDYGAYAAVTADKVWSESETSGKRQLTFRPKALGEAVQFRVRDTIPATLGTGKGIVFVGLSVDAAPKQGPTTALPHTNTSLRK